MNYLHELQPPAKWKAGTQSSGDFYFDCGGCGAKEPEIAGVIASVPESPTYRDVVVLRSPGTPFVRAAMFCRQCWDTQIAAART